MDENRMIAIASMFARQQIMIQMLMEHMESGLPLKQFAFMAAFLARWEKESTAMIAVIVRRLQRDDLTLTMDDLEREGLGPPPSEEKDDD